ncbi:MAG: magnesium transporter [Saprospiraceae bacterium]|jgi:magnesium transporter
MNKKDRKKKIGLPPGSVVFVGDRKLDKVFMSYLQYDEKQLSEIVYDNHKKIVLHQSPDEKVDWYDIRGLHDTKLIESLGVTFGLHPLILEAIADTYQRPKFDEYDTGIFLVIRALAFDKSKLEVTTEQIAIYFRKGLLLSFQEDETDLFAAVRHRLQAGHGRIRRRGADYLAYALADNVVDNYFVVLDAIEETIEDLESKLLQNPDNSVKERIHALKKELLIVRKSIGPLREAISRFAKSENSLVEESSSIFIRDLYDHTIQIMDMTENYRDMLNGLQDLHLSEISYRMNQVMQVMTIVTTVFVPLSFLAGLYGMNFENIPELHNQYGYFILLGVMLIISIGSILYFKSRKWL